MNNQPPLNEGITPSSERVSSGWSNWFGQVFRGLAWKKGFNVTTVLDFGSVAGHSQVALTVSIVGVRAGDLVLVTAPDTSGIVYTGSVTADNTVSVYAKNFTAGAIDPPSQTFRVVAFQN